MSMTFSDFGCSGRAKPALTALNYTRDDPGGLAMFA